MSDSFAEAPTGRDLAAVLPTANIFTRRTEPFVHYAGYTQYGGNLMGVAFTTTEVVPDECWGYRDQIDILVGVDPNGRIAGLKMLSEAETPKYTRGLLTDSSWFLKQFVGKDTEDEFLLGLDVDGITGATVSSSAIARAIEVGLELVSEKILGLEVNNDSRLKHVILHHLLVQIDFIFLWGLVGLAITVFFWNERSLRYLVLGASIVYLGLLKGGGFSINDVLTLLSFRLPIFSNNLYWYSLVVIAIGLSFVAGRLYCGWLCPFGAFTEILYGLVPLKWNVPENVEEVLKVAKYVILALLIAAVSMPRRELAGYVASIVEPFDTFFRGYGGPLAWASLLAILFLSIGVQRGYCKYFCPLGAFMALLTALGALLHTRLISVKLADQSCKGCRVAQKVCQMQAISYDEKLGMPEIDPGSCFMCNTCRRACPVTSDAPRHVSPHP